MKYLQQCLIFEYPQFMIAQRVVRQEEQKMVKKIKNYIYDPMEVIGSGFSSKVFKGVNELTQETIAVKVLQLSKIQSEVEKYLLNNEINALRALTHPHILKTVEILMTKNNVYIMTEFCEGGDLQQHIKKQGSLSQVEALHIIRDITDGYLAIQEKLIVHRDLKTASIFLTPSGARIADFGFCEFLSETKKPQLFYNVGSPAYMSPQSYRQNNYSCKSDIWSIGIILYEMLTGDTPDKNLTYSEMSNNLMAGRISCGPNEELRHILSLCFKKDLKERIAPLQLIDLVSNELLRLEGTRPTKPQPIKINSSNRVVSSAIPLDNNNQSANRGSSPIKARFNNGIMIREESTRNVDPSPVKVVQRRFSREQELPRSFSRIKSITEILLFLYRLLNSLAEVSLQRSGPMRLILFRHRSHLETLAEKVAQEEHLDRGAFEPLKEFYFLKSRFDETYLQKESQPQLSVLPLASQRLQQLANQSFVDLKSIRFHCIFTLEIGSECQNKLMGASDQNQVNQLGVILDYLLLHFEILGLYSEGKSVETISQEFLQLSTLLKDQPRRLGPFHLSLLRHKLKLCNKYLEESIGQDRPEESVGYKQLNEIPERKVLLSNGFF